MPAPGEKPHTRGAAPRQEREAIVLNLVQPLAAGGQLVGFGWKARRDEASWKGTTCGPNKVQQQFQSTH